TLLNADVCISNRTFKIAPANAELDREIASIPFSIDEGSAGLLVDIRHLTQRNVTAWSVDGDIRDVFRRAPIFRKKTHDNIEAPLAIQHLSHGLPANGRLHDAVNVVREASITRGALPVNPNEDVGLPAHSIYAQVCNAGHALHDSLISSAVVWSCSKSLPNTLTEFCPFTP